MNNKMIYITGSFPSYKDGIGEAAGRLFEAIDKTKYQIWLVTTNKKEITDYVNFKKIPNVIYMDDWKFTFRNLKKLFYEVERKNPYCIQIEYPGGAYGKNIGINLFPLYYRLMKIGKHRAKICLRLHEFTKARLSRRLSIIPMLLFSDSINIPSYYDYEVVHRIFKSKTYKSYIGSNIAVTGKEKKRKDDKINVSYFGYVYKGKGIEKLLWVWSELNKKYPNKYRFTIIGEFSPDKKNRYQQYHKQIEQLMIKYDIKDLIYVTGYITNEEVSEELFNTDIALLPYEDGLSLRRGSFLAFLEHGIPIVTTCGDVESKAFFEENTNVKMCNSVDEMTQAVIDMSSKKTKTELRIDQRLLWDNIANDLLESYFDIVK